MAKIPIYYIKTIEGYYAGEGNTEYEEIIRRNKTMKATTLLKTIRADLSQAKVYLDPEINRVTIGNAVIPDVGNTPIFIATKTTVDYIDYPFYRITGTCPTQEEIEHYQKPAEVITIDRNNLSGSKLDLAQSYFYKMFTLQLELEKATDILVEHLDTCYNEIEELGGKLILYEDTAVVISAKSGKIEIPLLLEDKIEEFKTWLIKEHPESFEKVKEQLDEANYGHLNIIYKAMVQTGAKVPEELGTVEFKNDVDILFEPKQEEQNSNEDNQNTEN